MKKHVIYASIITIISLMIVILMPVIIKLFSNDKQEELKMSQGVRSDRLLSYVNEIVEESYQETNYVEELGENSNIEIKDNNMKEVNSSIIKQVKTPEEITNSQIITKNEEITAIIDQPLMDTESIGILKIPKINVNVAVSDGHSLDMLETTVGHFDDTAYWQGNIGILGHNFSNKPSGFFKNLDKLVVGDKITYITEYGTRTYEVNNITKIADNDWSVLANTTDNRITLITCVRNDANKRLCIQAIEI